MEKEKKMTNVIFAGVGGQGVILASSLLMEVARTAGYDVKESEVHGMAQRGGSVDCNVRFGKAVYSPLIGKGTADYVVSFELLEVMRKLEYLSPAGMIIASKEQIDPVPVQNGVMQYPADLEKWLTTNVKRTQLVDIAPILKEVGSRKAVNIVMLGILSKQLEFTNEQWEQAIRKLVKEKFLEMNLKAFKMGREV